MDSLTQEKTSATETSAQNPPSVSATGVSDQSTTTQPPPQYTSNGDTNGLNNTAPVSMVAGNTLAPANAQFNNTTGAPASAAKFMQPGTENVPVSPLSSLKEIPLCVDCPRCERRVFTRVTKEPGSQTHCAAFGLCILCGIIGGIIPYLIDSCKNTEHYCSNCGLQLAIFGSGTEVVAQRNLEQQKILLERQKLFDGQQKDRREAQQAEDQKERQKQLAKDQKQLDKEQKKREKQLAKKK